MSRKCDRGLLRLLTAILATSVAAVHFAALFHLTFVAHEVCAEHGHLTHASEPAANDQRQAMLETAAIRAEGDEQPHDHCLPVGARDDEVLVPEPKQTGLTLAGPESPALAPLTETRPLAGIDILLIAPKQSPPCVGLQRSAARAS